MEREWRRNRVDGTSRKVDERIGLHKNTPRESIRNESIGPELLRIGARASGEMGKCGQLRDWPLPVAPKSLK